MKILKPTFAQNFKVFTKNLMFNNFKKGNNYEEKCNYYRCCRKGFPQF